VKRLLRVPALVLLVYGGMIVLTWWGVRQLPTGFIPTQDKGYLIASIQMPDATAAQRTRDVIARIEKIALETPGIKNCNSVAGNSFILSAYGSNFGSMFIILKGFEERRGPDMHSDAIIAQLKKRFAAEIPEANVNVFPPPAVSGLGRAGGFKLMVEDRGELGKETLQTYTDQLVEKGNKQTGLSGLFTVYKANSPQLFVDVNRDACQARGINPIDVFGTLQASLGSRYVNDFNRFDHTYQVIVQGDQRFRNDIEDVRKLKVRNRHGDMVPLGAVMDVKQAFGPDRAIRYNAFPSADIQGAPGPGTSSSSP